MLPKSYVDEYEIEVAVIGGEHKGKLGLIDDWDEEGRAIVYLDGRAIHHADDYAVIGRRALRLATEEEARRRQQTEIELDKSAESPTFQRMVPRDRR